MLGIMKNITMILAMIPLWGCGPICAQLETRCFAGNPQVCDSRGRWQTVLDCQEVSEASGGEGDGGWACQPFDGGHTCLP
jgi:hypothetical protein